MHRPLDSLVDPAPCGVDVLLDPDDADPDAGGPAAVPTDPPAALDAAAHHRPGAAADHGPADRREIKDPVLYPICQRRARAPPDRDELPRRRVRVHDRLRPRLVVAGRDVPELMEDEPATVTRLGGRPPRRVEQHLADPGPRPARNPVAPLIAQVGHPDRTDAHNAAVRPGGQHRRDPNPNIVLCDPDARACDARRHKPDR